MTIHKNFSALYLTNLNQQNNKYILGNPNIRQSLILFFNYFDNQFFLKINEEKTDQIILNYFTHLDEKERLTNDFIKTFSQNEVTTLKDFLKSPNLINFTDLGYLHNLLLWFLFFKNKELGNIDDFIILLTNIDDYNSLELKFNNLGFVENPNIDYNYAAYSLKSFNVENTIIANIFYNLLNQQDPTKLVLSKNDYFNLLFIFNTLDSRLTLINYYNDRMPNLSLRPFFKIFQSIISNVKNNT
jgi:hypothetical protein